MTITIDPCANAPIKATCNFRHEKDEPAIVDAKSLMGSWAYMCAEHLETHGTSDSQLVNNITSSPLNFERSTMNGLKLVSHG